MKRVLVIEDNDDVRREIVEILGFEGYEVAEATNGRHGLACLERDLPDLVLCDLMMPDMDGYQTLEAVRANPAWATLPFVMLTARAERQDMRRGMELGADDYLTKPFTVDELIAAVEAALQKRARVERESESRLGDLREQLSEALPHELRTPLACIMGYAEILADRDATAEPQQVAELAQRILGAGMRINRITENALLYVQLELLRRGRGDVRAQGHGVAVPVHEVGERAARAKASLHGRDGDLVLELAPATTAVAESYVVKVIEELVDNAFKFSAPTSPVRVTTATVDGHALIRVMDRGCGMTAEQAKAVAAYVQFERFLREQQGLGLGLSIAQRIVTLWGGEFHIESHAGTGTTVSAAIPTTCAAAAGAGRAVAKSAAAQADERM